MALGYNKKAHFDYEILDTLEAGIVLTGSEVKSLRMGNVNMQGSFIKILKGKLILHGVHIGTYKPASTRNHIADRDRELLIHSKQITRLMRALEEKGHTIVALEIYSKGPWIKVKIAIARGKKLHDKRDASKKRTEDRDIKRALKQF